MAHVFDGPELTIILHAGGSVHTVEWVEVFSRWKEWVKGTGHQYEPAFDILGGDPLTASLNAGTYVFLRNDLGWRIRPAEEDSTISVIGNIVGRDITLPLFVPTVGAFTVLINGIQQVTQSVDPVLELTQENAFHHSVSIDIANGVAGTVFPIGTPSNPSNNLADAKIIADANNITEFVLVGVITLTEALNGWKIKGASSEDNDRVNLSGQSVNGSIFKNLKLSGAASGSSVIEARKCSLDALSGARGLFRSCGLENNITLAAGASTFDKCFSEVAGNTKPWVDVNGGNSNINVRGFQGGFELRGVSHVSALVTVDMDGGRLLLAASNTGGEIVAGGLGEFEDLSVGSAIVDTILTPERQKRLLRATAYRQYTNPSTGKLDIHDDDDILDQSVDIFEDDGVTPWDGVGPIVRRNKVT